LARCHAVLLTFAWNNRKSFEKIVEYIKETLDIRKNDSACLFVLVGTKSELTERDVDFDEAKSLAESFGMPFFSTSSLTNSNVQEMIDWITNEVVRSSKLRGKIVETERINLRKDKKFQKSKCKP
jgi:GTPase SAR1 family protein